MLVHVVACHHTGMYFLLELIRPASDQGLVDSEVASGSRTGQSRYTAFPTFWKVLHLQIWDGRRLKTLWPHLWAAAVPLPLCRPPRELRPSKQGKSDTRGQLSRRQGEKQRGADGVAS